MAETLSNNQEQNKNASEKNEWEETADVQFTGDMSPEDKAKVFAVAESKAEGGDELVTNPEKAEVMANAYNEAWKTASVFRNAFNDIVEGNFESKDVKTASNLDGILGNAIREFRESDWDSGKLDEIEQMVSQNIRDNLESGKKAAEREGQGYDQKNERVSRINNLFKEYI